MILIVFFVIVFIAWALIRTNGADYTARMTVLLAGRTAKAFLFFFLLFALYCVSVAGCH